MSDQQVETPEVPQEGTEENKPEQKGTTITDVSALQSELNKARQDAARYRTEANEREEAAKKWAEFEESQKSELQKAQEAQDALRQELEQQRIATTRSTVAIQYGLSADDLDLLGTGDEATLQARAQRIQALHQAAAATPPPTNLPQGNPVPGTTPATPAPTGPAFPSSWANL